MGSRWCSAPLAVLYSLLLGGALEAGAVGPLQAQRVREVGIQATATASDPAAALAGLYGAIRPSSRARISLAASVGTADGETAWRAELLAHFLLNPVKRRGPGFYGAAGIAGVAGPFERGYLVFLLGAEGRPGARSGWVVEAGVGGGARLVVGYRWRWFPAGWILQQ